MAPLSRSPARIASVRIPSGSLGDTGAATGTAPCGRAQPSRPAMHSHHGVVLITDCSGASSLAWQGRLAVRSGLMPASRAFCALRWPMSNSHPGLGLRGRRPSWRRWTGCWLRRGPVRAGCWSWAARRESAIQRGWITCESRRLVSVWENREILAAGRRPGLPLCTSPLGLPRAWLRFAAQGNRKA